MLRLASCLRCNSRHHQVLPRLDLATVPHTTLHQRGSKLSRVCLQLLEVVMDLGRTPLARFPYGDVEISNEPIGHTDLELAVAQVADFGSDNRAGINATLHRISCMRNRTGRIVGLTARVGRSVPGSAAMITDLAMDGASILLLGRPGSHCQLVSTPFSHTCLIPCFAGPRLPSALVQSPTGGWPAPWLSVLRSKRTPWRAGITASTTCLEV